MSTEETVQAEQQPAVVFDAARKINVKADINGTVKKLTVRFPTDAEWCERARVQKIISKQLGRGREQTTVKNADQTNMAMLREIVEDGTQIEGILPAEARRILEALSRADAEGVEFAKGIYLVSLSVPGGTVKHLLNRPNADQVEAFSQASVSRVSLPYNTTELTVHPAAAAELWRELNGRAVGYAGDVPVVHKLAAVRAVIDAYRSELEDDDPNG